MNSTITHLECSKKHCGKKYPHDRLQNLCACGAPLLARYDLPRAAKTLTRAALSVRPANMWRYEEILPAAHAVTLGEGMTPLIHARRVGQSLGLAELYVKDEEIGRAHV